MNSDTSGHPGAQTDSLRLRFGVMFISLAVLVVELALIRVMDVILAPNTGYMVLTSAMFALGLGGIVLYLFPAALRNPGRSPAYLALAFAVATPAILPVLNFLPFDADFTGTGTGVQILAWAGMYLTLIVPFLIGGVILASLFTTYSGSIHRLYLFDLVGAGLACLMFIPLLPHYGPGGLLWVAAGFALLAAGCFSDGRGVAAGAVAVAVAAVAYPLLGSEYLDFRGHANKRGNDTMVAQGKREYMKWDPVSKFEVMKIGDRVKLFSLDGGQQGSWLGRFDGDFAALRDKVRNDPDRYYYGRNSIVHHLYRNRSPEVLVIGSAAGGEVKAALASGAAHVDAVEMVAAMVTAVQTRYAEFSGGIYNHPDVTAIAGEGRTYLRSTPKRYDIIQMFSNHTSSTIASGAGAAGVAYLQTVEAYIEYFEHLKPDGALQINHHIYPRMLTVAAQAWHQIGRRDFWRHVLVLESREGDTLPTTIIKMQPWTAAEVSEVFNYANRESTKAAGASPAMASARIHEGHPFATSLTVTNDVLEGLNFRVGTYQRQGLPFDLRVRLLDRANAVVREARVDGAAVKDNAEIAVRFEPMTGVRNAVFVVEVAAPGAAQQDGVSIWLDNLGWPLLTTLPASRRMSYALAFDPLNPKNNLVPAELLQHPFPYDKADTIPWNLTPVTDDSPYFGMIRKFNRPMVHGAENVIDFNSAYLLNERLQKWVPKDWFHLFVVAIVSVAFALVFLLVPFLVTNLRHARWNGMSYDISYFACLGLGFILIQVAFIQLFNKLIGFPTHTFVAVVFSMLLSAGLGSGYSARFAAPGATRWRFVFYAIVAYGIVFTLVHKAVFHASLGLPLSGRLLVAVAMIAPLGFLLGMPFPLGIERLARRSNAAVSWAWAVNGFFTVVGGYLALIVSIRHGFSAVLYFATAVYALAYLLHRRVRALPVEVPLPVAAAQSSSAPA